MGDEVDGADLESGPVVMVAVWNFVVA